MHGNLPKSMKHSQRNIACSDEQLITSEPNDQIMAVPVGQVPAGPEERFNINDQDDRIAAPDDQLIIAVPDDQLIITVSDDQTNESDSVGEKSLDFLINLACMSPVATQSEKVKNRSKIIFKILVSVCFSYSVVHGGRY